MDIGVFIQGKRVEEVDGDRFVDSRTGATYTREWFENQPYFADNELSLLTEGLGVPEESVGKINRILGGTFADMQEAGFVPQDVLKAVPGHDALIPELLHYGCPPPLFPRGSTLSPSRVAATIYNKSGETVRSVIEVLDDDELKEKAMEVTSDKEDVVRTTPGIHFQSMADTEDVFRNVELLNKEAKELLELFGDGVVDAVRDLVTKVAEATLARADLSYESLVGDVRNLTGAVAAEKISKDVEYSTLNPKDYIELLMRYMQFIVTGLVGRLPDERSGKILKRVLREEEVA